MRSGSSKCNGPPSSMVALSRGDYLEKIDYARLWRTLVLSSGVSGVMDGPSAMMMPGKCSCG